MYLLEVQGYPLSAHSLFERLSSWCGCTPYCYVRNFFSPWCILRMCLFLNALQGMSVFAINSTTEKHLNWTHVDKKCSQQNYYPLVLSVMSHTRVGGEKVKCGAVEGHYEPGPSCCKHALMRQPQTITLFSLL
jgi:hypothetical protein